MYRRHSVFDFPTLFRSFDNLFRGFDDDFATTRRSITAGQNAALPAPSAWCPAVESFARKDDLVLRVELPGVGPDDVEVTVDQGRLIVRGEKRNERESDEGGTYLRELSYGRFERSFTLPEGVQPGQVKASFSNGVLEVRLPAKGLVPEARRIPVEVDKGGKRKVA